ncbi:neutral zinc metallopeptidase [Devosia sp.]|uniref:neutral zinc metallopeptidase n=1 Tax=Devosia sp. TaxID=1871048 RepID=UPI00343BCDB8
MKWQGRERSSNIEDRRSQGGGMGGFGGSGGGFRMPGAAAFPWGAPAAGWDWSA